MMDYIAGLVQRGLISPDVAQGLVQQIANIQKPGVPNPPLEGGGAGTRLGETTTREPLLGYSNPKEFISNSALRHQDTGKVYTGQSHADAVTKAQKDYPGNSVYDQHLDEGFVTNTGRYVDRNQASKIAKEAGQSGKRVKISGQDELLSEGLDTSERYRWIPRRELDQGMNYNPKIVPDEPLLEKAPAGESPRYSQEKAWRDRVGDKANDARRARRARQQSSEE